MMANGRTASAMARAGLWSGRARFCAQPLDATGARCPTIEAKTVASRSHVIHVFTYTSCHAEGAFLSHHTASGSDGGVLSCSFPFPYRLISSRDVCGTLVPSCSFLFHPNDLCAGQGMPREIP